MHSDDDEIDGLGGPWDRPDADDSSSDASTDTGSEEEEEVVEVLVGPPIRVTFVLRAEKVPIAPWAQGWRIGALGPDNGQVMLVCEHDIELSPVAQLSAITGLLGTIKQAKLDVAWWAIQTRGPLEVGEASPADGLDAEFTDLLRGEAPEPPPNPED